MLIPCIRTQTGWQLISKLLLPVLPSPTDTFSIITVLTMQLILIAAGVTEDTQERVHSKSTEQIQTCIRPRVQRNVHHGVLLHVITCMGSQGQKIDPPAGNVPTGETLQPHSPCLHTCKRLVLQHQPRSRNRHQNGTPRLQHICFENSLIWLSRSISQEMLERTMLERTHRRDQQCEEAHHLH
jgi:hypothetical protein